MQLFNEFNVQCPIVDKDPDDSDLFLIDATRKLPSNHLITGISSIRVVPNDTLEVVGYAIDPNGQKVLLQLAGGTGETGKVYVIGVLCDVSYVHEGYTYNLKKDLEVGIRLKEYV